MQRGRGAFTGLIGGRPRPGEIANRALTGYGGAGGFGIGGSPGELTRPGTPGGTGRDRWTGGVNLVRSSDG